jgi:O-antigen/teichoic acid export membrane protein
MNKVTSSSILLVLQRLAERALGVISTLVLARLLTPDDFGIIAIAMLILWFTEALSNAGTSAYIIQKKSVSVEELNSAWTLDLILKGLSFLLIIFSAPAVAISRENYSLGYVVCAIALTLPLVAIRNPGIWLLSREQSYSGIVKITVLGKVSGMFVSIPLAFYLQSFWAIVAGHLMSVAIKTVLSYKICDFRPSLNRDHILAQWQFSKWIIPQSLLGYFRNQVDTVVVSNRFSPSDLGAYNNLKYFASIPMLQILSPLAEPLHAEMGKVQNCQSEMQFQSDIAIKLLGFVGAPFASMFFVCSEPIVSLVLGDQWVKYHNVFSYFGLMIIPFVLFSQSSRMLMVKSCTKQIFMYELFCTALIGASLLLLPINNVEYFALFRISFESIMSVLFYCYATKKVFGRVSLITCITSFLPSTICILTLLSFKEGFLEQSGVFFQLFVLTLFDLIIVLVLFAIWYVVFASTREQNAIQKFSPLRKG